MSREEKDFIIRFMTADKETQNKVKEVLSKYEPGTKPDKETQNKENKK